MDHSRTPDVMPVLSRGKHRNPRKGACFMELASYLAGEPWSDHPKSTHPLLAVLARSVNDHLGDASRSRIAPLIPDVVGLNGDDPRVNALIAREAALAALPIVAFERQKVSAVGVLRCERVLNEIEGRPLEQLSDLAAASLAEVPGATKWAKSFTDLGFGSARTFGRRGAPAIVHSAVKGIAEASVADPDSILVDLLGETIAKCQTWFKHPATAPVPDDEWHKVCALTNG